MNAAEFAQWCDVAGLYLGNHSHGDRYRTFQKKLSRAGLAVRIVHDFLNDNEGGIDPQRWRSSSVYEIGAHASFRVEQTALALEEIGATRLAARVRSAKDTSIGGMLFQPGADPSALAERMRQIDPREMMKEFRANVARLFPDMAEKAGMPVPERQPVPPTADFESWEQVEHLLAKYVVAHESDLVADIRKYGDPRAQPGYDPQKREAELRQLRQRAADLDVQREEAPKLSRLLDEIESRAAREPGLKPARVAKQRREVLGAWRKYSERTPEALAPEMRKWVAHARRVIGQYPLIFRPRPTEDEQLLKRLDEFGPYEVDFDRLDRHTISVSWDRLAGLECEWTTISLTVRFYAEKPELLGRALDACDRLRNRFAVHRSHLRDEVLDHFEIYRDHAVRWLFEADERDHEGNPTESAILHRAGGGGIHITAADDSVEIVAYFHVEWDDEHGLEVSILDA